jgi:molecular chaperone GrpE
VAKKEQARDDLPAQHEVENDATDQAFDETAGLDQAQQESSASADLAAELDAEKDRTLRLQAEMQNLRQRTSRELADERRYGGLAVIRDVLPVLDNIERAIAAAEKNTDAEALLEGFRLVRQQLMNVLTQHHCEPIEAEGTPFNPDYHAAILQQPSDEHAAGTVMMAVQPGYRLHDRVVRPTQVIVSSGPASEHSASK